MKRDRLRECQIGDFVLVAEAEIQVPAALQCLRVPPESDSPHLTPSDFGFALKETGPLLLFRRDASNAGEIWRRFL
jgi:hypothetical protein